MIRICSKCGKEYETEAKFSMYCSTECKNDKICIICGKHFQSPNNKKTCSKECRKISINKSSKETCLKRYGVDNVMKLDEKKEKIKQTNLKKYGVESHNQLEGVKIKKQITCLKHYGVNWPGKSEEIKRRSKETCLKKYGTEYSLQNKEVREKGNQTKLKKYGDKNFTNTKKRKETNTKRYGVDNPFSNNTIKDKIKKTNLTNLGVDNPMRSDNILNKLSKHVQEKYNVPWSCMISQCRNAQGSVISKINKEIGYLLNIDENDYEFNIGRCSYDLKKDNVLIEINPSYTHNSTIGPYFGKGHQVEPKNKKYHLNKTKLANENGYRCIHIWDWDDLNKIKMMLDDKATLYARSLKLEVMDQKEVNKFLNQYHLQNAGKGQTICLCLMKDNEIVQTMTFGKPRYNKNYQWELIRLCTDSKYKVMGGSEKLFRHFTKEYNPESIISYCDNSKFSGDVYRKLGFELKTHGSPACHWYNPKTKRHILDSSLRMKGYSLLHNDENYEKAKKGDNNKTLMINDGYVEIYDCGQSVYTWNKDQ